MNKRAAMLIYAFICALFAVVFMAASGVSAANGAAACVFVAVFAMAAAALKEEK